AAALQGARIGTRPEPAAGSDWKLLIRSSGGTTSTDEDATRNRSSQNPTGRRAPPLAVWSLDWGTSFGWKIKEPSARRDRRLLIRFLRGDRQMVGAQPPETVQVTSCRASGPACRLGNRSRRLLGSG